MFNTFERARTPSPHTPDEIITDLRIHPVLDHKAGLEPVVYSNVTLYFGPPSKLQIARKGSGTLQDEIRFAEDETTAIGFEVNPFALPYSNLSKAHTMNLIWGGLGKTLETMAEDVGSALGTVRTHRGNLFHKLGTSSMSHAVKVAFDHRILKASPELDYKELDVTARELQVICSTARGSSKEETAAELFLSPATIRTHTQNVLHKNQLNNSAQAVMRACLSGQLPLASVK